MDTLLPGIYAERVPTSRLTVNVLAVAGRDDPAAPAVLFVHGNVSSSLFWQPMMLALPAPYRPLAIACAASATPTTSRSTLPAGCGTSPTTWPPPSTR
jgi:pimeloyl-ACP methyl ester carboxylesterase